MKGKAAAVANPGANINALLKKGKKARFPEGIKPMLATLVDKPVEEPGWMFEVKWDGYRSLGYVYNGVVDIRSRNNKSFNEKFYPVFNALQQWKVNAVIDGEILVVNEKGVPDFQRSSKLAK